MAGLQGSGKTTTSAKLARWFKQQGRNPLLVGADLQRPAAVEQLRTLGASIDVPVFSEPKDPVKVAKAGMEEASRLGRDVVIVDTAGRLAIDEELMEQVRDISKQVKPDYTFLVVDAMTGQDAVKTAESFHQTLELDGVILTKLDGDARGGAALSVKEVVGRPIAFASTGEKLEDFDLFHPDRLAGRILGMGDVLTLIEKAEEVYEAEQAEEAVARLLEGSFTLDDFLDQMQQLKKMGPLSGIIGMLPGMPKEVKDAEIGDDEMAPVEAIIRSMTAAERVDPKIIDGSRRRRIADGSGTSPNRGQPAHQAVQGDAADDARWAQRRRGPGAKGAQGQEEEGRSHHRQGRRPDPQGAPGAPRPELRSPRSQERRRVGTDAGSSPRPPAGQERSSVSGSLPRRSPGSFRPGRQLSNRPARNQHVAVKLRLMRMGKKKQPTYRIVAADAARRATAGSSRSSAPTTPGRAVGRQDRQRARPSTGSARAPSPPSGSRSSLQIAGAWDEFKGNAPASPPAAPAEEPAAEADEHS